MCVCVHTHACVHTTETLRMLEVTFREQIRVKTQFSKFGSGVMSVEDCEHSGCPCQAKWMTMWIEWRNFSPKAEESLSVKCLMWWEFYLGQFKGL